MAIKEVISIREYARRLNVDEKAVRKARDAGLLGSGYDAGTGKINPVAADKHWGYQHKVIKPKAGVSRKKAIEKIQASTSDAQTQKSPQKTYRTEDIEDLSIDDVDALLSSIKITKDTPADVAMKYRELIGLALDKQKLEETVKILVRRIDVDKALFDFGNELKKELVNLPRRIIDDILVAPSKVDAINILLNEINGILEKFSWTVKLND